MVRASLVCAKSAAKKNVLNELASQLERQRRRSDSADRPERPRHDRSPDRAENRPSPDRPAPGYVFANLQSKYAPIEPLNVPGQPPVPRLANKLERVLFSPGVHFLKDPRTNVYNFDPDLEHVMSITDFNFAQVPAYVPAGRDGRLAHLAAEQGKRYTGSTSSMTSVLTQLHHALSHHRPPQILNLPKYFPGTLTSFSAVQQAPTDLWLKHSPATGTHAVTLGNKSNEMILTLLGHAMETMLTTEATEFRKWSKRHPQNAEVQVVEDSTYNYTMCGPFLMRSQLDCYDPRLPGTGMFDLKTRACCAVRHDMDMAQIQDGSDYQIKKVDGQYESFSRELYELVRSAMFKYSLQARIGRMDGIFVAYHSVKRLFGFEYLPLSEIDKIYHTAHLVPPVLRKMPPHDKEEIDEQMNGVASLIADQEFSLSVALLGRIFDYVLENVPKGMEKEKVEKATVKEVKEEVAVEVSTEREASVEASEASESEASEARDTSEASASETRSEAPASELSDINITVHSDAPGSLVIFARRGNYESEAMLPAPKEAPADLRGWRVTLHQSINRRPVPTSRYPALESADDVWRVKASLCTMGAAELKAQYAATMALAADMELVTEPVTDKLLTPEEQAELLARLPAATQYQTLLRSYGEKGLAYSKWDELRTKIELKVE